MHPTATPPPTAAARHRVVIVGCGFAGRIVSFLGRARAERTFTVADAEPALDGDAAAGRAEAA